MEWKSIPCNDNTVILLNMKSNDTNKKEFSKEIKKKGKK